MNKLISSLTISSENIIDANGSTRTIIVGGESGARFSLTIKDGSERNILEDYLDNITIPKSGSYKITQKFPAYESNDFTRIDNTEVYEIKVIAGAFTKLDKDIVSSYEIKQYPDPTITITSDATIDTNTWGITASVSGADATLKGKAMREAATIPNNFKTSSSSTYTKRFGEIAYNITVTPSAGLLYISQTPSILTDLKKSTDVKRRAGEKKEEKDIILTLPSDDTVAESLKPLKEGMIYSGSYTYTKLFDSNVSDNNESKFSDKIKLSDTESLVIGMAITGDNVKGYVSIVSIDTATNITISLKQKLTKNDQLTFTKKFVGNIDNINSASDITTDSKEPITAKTEITLTNDLTAIHGMMRAIGSGTNTITLNSTYQVREFGKEDVTFTQLLGNFITAYPNAQVINITTTKNTAVTFDLLASDMDLNKSSKTPINEAQDDPSHGTLSETSWAAGVGTTIYTPHTGYTGTDKFYYYLQDANSQVSARTPVYITIT